MDVESLKSALPTTDRIASQLYGIDWRNRKARRPMSSRHSHGDRDPSLRYDAEKNRIFCASQECFGEKGADAIEFVRVMENASFREALTKLAEHYGVPLTEKRNGHVKGNGHVTPP